MSATIELEKGGHRDGAGAEAGKVDSIDSATAATKAKAKKLDSVRHKMHAKEFVLKVKARLKSADRIQAVPQDPPRLRGQAEHLAGG